MIIHSVMPNYLVLRFTWKLGILPRMLIKQQNNANYYVVFGKNYIFLKNA